ncbi:glutamine--fructose-6-phosphate transaminase (isomerizing) [Candidatus Saccharibacteria bacterium]|nr:glutamine--fructose-6-phosphate transaminase (isomerizing) [Candidatus Saccharibacteria bacterium]
MCGIIGLVSSQSSSKNLEALVTGLRRMEYRGYDSVGVAYVKGGQIKTVRSKGKISELETRLGQSFDPISLGIGHTRWATHGDPSEINAHPHTAGKISIVHNGIIENYQELKQELIELGCEFSSETDSEVVAQLVNHYYQELSFIEAVKQTLTRLKGAYGLAIITEDRPDQLIVARQASPLLIGLSDQATYIASDPMAIINYTDRIIYLEDGEYAILGAGSYQVYDFDHNLRDVTPETIELNPGQIQKSGYDHFLIKEIMEQPEAVINALRGRLDKKNFSSHLGGLNLPDNYLREVDRILIVACGTAYYAGLLGKYLLEKMLNIPVDVEMASEFRYRDPATSKNTLGVVYSQSGETADSLASLREMKRRGMLTLGIINTAGSTIAREVDGGIYLHAGPEISVASTKAFSSMSIATILLGLEIGRYRKLSIERSMEVIQALGSLANDIEEVLRLDQDIKFISSKIAKFQHMMYLGRDSLYPIAIEGSHKLKEVSYIQAEAYPAGEMKHGANALLGEDLLVVFFLSSNFLYDKAKSNLAEIKARTSNILVITDSDEHDLSLGTMDVIRVKRVSDWTQGLLFNVVSQLIAYHVAVKLDRDVDQPRNLAKSVTVE